MLRTKLPVESAELRAKTMMRYAFILMTLLFSGCSDNMPLKIKGKIYASAKQGDVGYLRQELRQGLNPNLYDEDKGYLISHAVLWKKPEIVRLLIASGADVNAKKSGMSGPLVAAVVIGECESAKLLLAAGSNPNERFVDAWKAALGPDYQDKTVRQLYQFKKKEHQITWKAKESCWLEWEKMIK